jgi:hypothetical protein
MQAIRWNGFWASSIAVIVVLTTLALLPSFGGGAVPSGPNPPLGVHLSYLDDPTTAAITWYTASASTSRAEWGPILGPPYAFQTSGVDYSSPGGSFLHRANLTGLTPGAKYYYRVGNAAMTASFGQTSFRAAPPKGSADTFTFAAAGDWGNTTQTLTTSNEIAKRNPNFVLPLGDLYYSHTEPGVKGTYDKWQIFAQSAFLQSAAGNHEVDESGSDNTPTLVHCAYSTLPGNERTYAFTWGNTYFVTMDWGGSTTNQSDGVDGTPQNCTGLAGTAAIRGWVDGKLAAADANPTIRWIIVYHHFPCYDMQPVFVILCDPTPTTPPNTDQIEDILVNRHVDLVLAGHDHTYGRTHPVAFRTVAQTGNAYDTPGAPIYLIIGTGGASGGTPDCRTDPWVAACSKGRGFGWFQVSPTTIRYEFKDNSGVPVDAFTLTKRPAAGFVVSTDPSAVHAQPGETASTTASVIGASSEPVGLTVSGCPLAATCSATPSSGNPPFTSTVSVATGPSTPEADYRLTVTASSTSASVATPFDLTVATRITRTYQKGDGGPFSETDDATIDSGTPSTPQGGSATLRVDASCQNTAGRICRSLIKFPSFLGTSEGQVPRGARILSATLQMRISDPGSTEDIIQLLVSWDEATVTWNTFTTPGLPRTADPVFTFAPSSSGPFSINVTFIVQKWADGDPNNGVFLTSTGGDGVVYDSSEGTVANRPKLTVLFERPLAPSRDPRLWPFSSDSVWNLPIGASAVYVPAGIAQATAWGMTTDPDVLILDPSAPIIPVYFNSDAWTGQSRCDIQGGVQFEAPIPAGFIVPGATPTSTPNHAVAILDADGKTLIQGQPYTHCTAEGPVTIWWFQKDEQLDGTGFSGGHRGSKLSSIGGTIRLGELVPGGVIRHAMKVSLDGQANLFFDTSTAGLRWPATVADLCAPTCYGGTNAALRMGALLALPASIDVDGMGLETEPAKIFAHAFQNYGAYVVDNAGWSVYGLDVESSPAGNVEAEFASSWGFSMAPDSKDVPWARDMDRIFGALNVVDNWDLSKWQTVSASGGTLGAGLGAPRSAWAPALGETPSPVPFDFSLSTSPSSGFVAVHGESVSASVTTQRTFGPSHSVQYSCTNLPSGSTCTFTPASGNPTSTASLVLATSSSTPAGTYAVSVRATDGTIMRASGFTLTVGDPLLAYDMETLSADGKMKDLSGHGKDGTITGTTDVAGKIGRARDFGAGDRITASPISVPATAFTVAAWFRWTTNPSPYYSGIQGGGYSWELRVTANGRFAVVFYQAIGPDIVTYAETPLAYNDGEWHHAAGVLRSGLAELYVDGVLVARATTNPITSVRTSTQTIVGRVANDFVGDIDEVLVFSRALSVAEIAALAPPPPAAASGLVLSYDMETLTASGLMKDLSGQAHHGILSGTTDVVGKVGQARQFSAGDRITASPISVPATAFTVAAWFRWTTNPSPYYSGIQGGGYSWELRVTPGGRFAVVFYQAIGPDIVTYAETPLAYNDGEWHHAVGVLRSGLARIYVDGLLVAQAATNPITSVRPSTLTEIGHVANYFVGDIDEVRVFSRALSDAEIAALAPPPPADGPVLAYDMETLTATGLMKDLSGHLNHGTITGTTDVAGKIGRARHLNAGDRITAPAISVPATDFTVAAWFRWTTNPSPYYGGIHGGSCCSWELRVMANGRFAVVFYQAIGPDIMTYAETALSYNDGTWHHAAGILRSGLAEIYVDGVLAAQDTTNPITSVRTSTQTVVGQVASGFVGDIDEVRVFSRALTPGEIATLASSTTNAVLYSQATLRAEGCHLAVGDHGDGREGTENSVHTTIRVLWIGLIGSMRGILQLAIGSVFVAVAFRPASAKSRVRTGGVLGRGMRGRRP